MAQKTTVMSVICSMCNKSLSSRSAYGRHVREVHKTDLVKEAHITDPYQKRDTWSNQCLEDGCDRAFSSNKLLLDHLQYVHLMDFQTESYSMNNIDDFEKWKLEIENSNNCSYIFKNSYNSSRGRIIYYTCNRSKSSYVLKKSNQRSRQLKIQGSCKMNHACTSHIKAIHKNGEILVEWQKVHYGHSLELQHIRIPKLEKQNIASKIIDGLTPQRILESTCDNFGESSKRVDLLTLTDISNIKNSFGIESNDGVDSSDTFSTDQWVQECQSFDENPVLLYKPQGQEHEILKRDDFCLIIMNKIQRQMIGKFPNIITIEGAYGSNDQDFGITIVLVMDEINNRFPVAVMLSNRKDIEVQSIFFSLIKEKVGVLTPKVFMSDIDETSFNAWKIVMGESAQHFFYSWNVDKAWLNELHSISNEEKCSEVYELLKALQLDESESSFLTALNSGITYMCNDRESQVFGMFFKKTYGSNFRKWADCFRKEYHIIKNMFSNEIDKFMKSFKSEQMTIEYLDKGLLSILKFIRRKSEERMSLIKGESIKHKRELARKHKQVLDNRDNYAVIDYTDTYWQLSKNDQVSYAIHQLLDKKCCEQICTLCDACNHMYSCECKFYKENKRMCKHIHFITANLIVTTEFDQEDFHNETTSMLEESSDKSQHPQDSYQLLYNMEEKIRQLVAELGDVKYEDLEDSVICKIHDHLLIVRELANSSQVLTNDELEDEIQSSSEDVHSQMSQKNKEDEDNTSLNKKNSTQMHTVSQENSIDVPQQSYDHDYCVSPS